MIIKIDNPLFQCELKFKGDKGEFTGYASVFGGVDAVRDTILPGAFKKTIEEDAMPKMFINHGSWEVPVGDWKHIEEDSKGLLAHGMIDFNHTHGQEVHSALKRGAMDGLSIGFQIPAGGATEKEDGIREISRIDLKEISVVNFPADDGARVSVVKFEVPEFKSFKEAEGFLRDAGFSREAAKVYAGRVKLLTLRDVELRFKDQNAAHDVTQRLAEFIRKL